MIHVLLKQLFSSFDANRFALYILKCIPRTQPTVIWWHHCRLFVWFHAASAQNKTSFYATFFFLQTQLLLKRLWYDSWKKHFDVWNRWVFPYRLTPIELSWPSSFCVRWFWWILCRHFILRGLILQAATLVWLNTVIVGWSLPAKGQCYIHYIKLYCEVVMVEEQLMCSALLHTRYHFAKRFL